MSATVARAFAGIVVDLKARGRRVPVLDAMIAATALVEQIPLVTQDGDHDSIAGLDVVRV